MGSLSFCNKYMFGEIDTTIKDFINGDCARNFKKQSNGQKALTILKVSFTCLPIFTILFALTIVAPPAGVIALTIGLPVIALMGTYAWAVFTGNPRERPNSMRSKQGLTVARRN